MAGTAGRSGRRPKPTARKELAGNPGKRALNKEEPVFTPINGVSPPDWFNEEDMPLASVMWELTTKELCGQGLLCVTDLAVLERWCVAYEFWRRAVKNIAKEGNTWICPYISRHLLSLNPLLARCRRYSRGER
ncbi:P27 family phage terminase small subunit [Salmonella enterica]|uniref:P27 family phage terminase small subunit n=1 Tax=Salmonella enterica TaxID=28901 RepID=UPI0032C4087B